MCLPSAINLLLPFLLPSPQKLIAFRINFKCRLRGNYNNPSFLSLPTHIHTDTHTHALLRVGASIAYSWKNPFLRSKTDCRGTVDQFIPVLVLIYSVEENI